MKAACVFAAVLALGSATFVPSDPLVATLATTQSNNHIYGAGITTVSAADGSFYTCGFTSGHVDGHFQLIGSHDMYIRKWDNAMNHIWTRFYEAAGDSRLYACTVDADHNVYATGWTSGHIAASPSGSYDTFLCAFDKDGNELWKRQFGGAYRRIYASSVSYNMGLGFHDGVLFGGHISGESQQLVLTAYNVSDAGSIIWTRDSESTAVFRVMYDYYRLNMVAVDPRDGSVAIVGSTDGTVAANAEFADPIVNRGMDVIVAKYAKDGTPVFRTAITSPGSDYPGGVTFDGEGHVLVSGTADQGLGDNAPAETSSYWDAYLAKLDGVTGAQLWARMRAPAVNVHYYGQGVQTLPNGQIVWVVEEGDYFHLAVYDATGQEHEFQYFGETSSYSHYSLLQIGRDLSTVDAQGRVVPRYEVFISGEARAQIAGTSLPWSTSYYATFVRKFELQQPAGYCNSTEVYAKVGDLGRLLNMVSA